MLAEDVILAVVKGNANDPAPLQVKVLMKHLIFQLLLLGELLKKVLVMQEIKQQLISMVVVE